MIDPRWTTWIKGSIWQYFTANKGSYDLFLEEQNIKDSQAWAELKIIGPRFTEQTKGQFDVEVDVHLMCSVLSSDDVYKIADMIGYFQSIFVDIPVNKIKDTNELFGCLRRLPRPLITTPWGKANPSNDAELMSIDGFYKMEIV